MITLSLICCSNAYCENYENNPEVCTYVINNVTNESEKEVAYFFRGRYYYDNNEFKKAIPDFTESIKRAKKEGSLEESYYFRGMSYYWSGNFNNAVADLTEAIKRSNDIPGSQAENYLYRARAYLMLENLTMAINDANVVIKRGYADKESWAVAGYYVKAAANMGLKNYSEASANYTKFIQLVTTKNLTQSYVFELGDSYYYRGIVRIMTGNSHNDALLAFQDMEKAIKVYSTSNDPEAVNKKANVQNILKEIKSKYYQ